MYKNIFVMMILKKKEQRTIQKLKFLKDTEMILKGTEIQPK